MLKPIKGFTLLELMVAVLILLTAILGLLSVFINCIFLNETNRNMVTAANDAQYVLEQIKSLPYSSIPDYPEPSLYNLKDEHIDISIDNHTETRITQIDVTISWTERGRSKNLQLSTRIAQ